MNCDCRKTHKALPCVPCREQRPRGDSEEWPNQGRVYHSERHRQEGETVPRHPIRPPPRRTAPAGCSSECRAVGGREELHTPASHVRARNPKHNSIYSWTEALFSLHLCRLQVHPRPTTGRHCCSGHVRDIYPPRDVRGLPVSECVHSS